MIAKQNKPIHHLGCDAVLVPYIMQVSVCAHFLILIDDFHALHREHDNGFDQICLFLGVFFFSYIRSMKSLLHIISSPI